VPIKSDKVRIAILSSQQKTIEIQQLTGPLGSLPAEGLMERYDELFVSFNDALEGVRADLRQASKEQTARSGVTEASLQKLQAFLTWQKLHHTVIRTLLLVETFKRNLAGEARPSSSAGGGGGSSRRVSPDDIVRLYDSIISSLGEMSQLEGYREDEALMSQVGARQAAAKACRCFFLAESYGVATRYAEAQALYSRSEELMSEATQLLEEADYKPESAELHSLAKLAELIDGARARAHAEAFVKTLTGGEGVSETEGALGRMGLAPTAAPSATSPLLDSLNVFERAKPEYLVDFPPDFETTPCKPLLFDIARNQVRGPDLSARIKGKGGSGYLSKASSYFFGR